VILGPLGAVAAAAVLAAIALAALFRWRDRLPLAQVNERTLHTSPIPRVGGLALWAGFIPVALATAPPGWMSPSLWGGPWLLLVAVSLRDDIRSVGVLPRLAVAAGAWGAWFPVLVFLPFAADASATLSRRVLLRERFWESHKSHYYQRLHRMGAGHRGTLAAGSALMIGCAATAVGCAVLAPQWGPAALATWCALHAVLFAAIDYHWRRSAPTT
jgi:hypothetical protein